MRIMISLGVTQYRKMYLSNFQTLVTVTSFISTVWDFEKRPVVLIWILSQKNQIFKKNRTLEN